MRRLASAVSPASTARRSSSSTGAMSGAAGLGLVGTKKRSCDSETTCRSAGPKMTAPTLPPPTTRPCSHMGASVSVSNTVVLTSRSPCVLLADVHAPRRGACTSARRTHGEREVSTTVFDTETEAPMWEHGLVVGGGSVGAVIFGPADRQVVSLSHERFFVPTNPSPAAPDIAPVLDELRRAVRGGRAGVGRNEEALVRQRDDLPVRRPENDGPHAAAADHQAVLPHGRLGLRVEHRRAHLALTVRPPRGRTRATPWRVYVREEDAR